MAVQEQAEIRELRRMVGRYEVLDVIGAGASSVVYRAAQRTLDRQVALKELAPYYATDRRVADWFVQKSRVTAAIDHPSIVAVHEYFEEGGIPYIAMEYLARGSLRAHVGRLGSAAVVGMLESVLAALAYGESVGIAHGGLKPENLLIDDEGRVKIADFGVARVTGHVVDRRAGTAAAMMIGTPAYLAPEQARGGEPTPATDLYSLGVVVWELLSGRSPFAPGAGAVDILDRRAREDVEPIRTVLPQVDPRFEEWLARMVDRRPERRFQGAQRAWEALEDVVIERLGPRWRRAARFAWQEPGAGPRPQPAASPSPAAPPPPAASPPPAGRAEPAPVGRPPRPPRSVLLAAAAAASVVLALVLVLALTAGGTPRRDASARSAAALGAGASPGLEQAVSRLNGIVELFVAGRRLSRHGEFAAAAQNRRLVRARLASFDGPSPLRAAARTLDEMALDSLSFNLDMARGETELARTPDRAHNALRPRFAAEFNPYALRQLGVVYAAGDL